MWDAQPSVADFVTGCVAHAAARLQHSAAAVSAAGMVSWIELQYLSRPSHFLATRFLDSFVCLPGCAQGLLVQQRACITACQQCRCCGRFADASDLKLVSLASELFEAGDVTGR